jgi:hypothetical protein
MTSIFKNSEKSIDLKNAQTPKTLGDGYFFYSKIFPAKTDE